MLKLYVYGYLHQLASSRKLEREAGRNIELMWLSGKLVPDFKTIADFRHDNASAIQIACQRFVAICRALGLVGGGVVAIDGSRSRAVNTHEKNYTKGKLARRKAHVEESIARYLAELEEADRAEIGPAAPRINAPLGTMGARAAAAASMGLLTRAEFEEAELIRKIRNEFAHGVHVSFETPSVKSLCKRLTMDAKPYGDIKWDPRTAFVSATMSVMLKLNNRAAYVKRHRLAEKDWPKWPEPCRAGPVTDCPGGFDSAGGG